jgi:hypothetical protein
MSAINHTKAPIFSMTLSRLAANGLKFDSVFLATINAQHIKKLTLWL